jgi:hypothetical protein
LPYPSRFNERGSVADRWVGSGGRRRRPVNPSLAITAEQGFGFSVAGM